MSVRFEFVLSEAEAELLLDLVQTAAEHAREDVRWARESENAAWLKRHAVAIDRLHATIAFGSKGLK